MKALSVKQPYASWIAEGKKTIETRTWQTKHRGKLLIVSSKKPHEDFEPEEVEGLPLGMALAIVNLTDCRPMIAGDEEAACCEWYDGAWAWVLSDVKEIEPFEVKGQLNVFNVEIEF